MLGRGIATGKNKEFYKLIGKKYLNKKSFPYGKKLILILLEKEKLWVNMKLLFLVVKK